MAEQNAHLAQVLIRDNGAKDDDEEVKHAKGEEYSMSVGKECVVESAVRRKEVMEGYEILKKLQGSNFDVRILFYFIPTILY